MSEPVNDKQYVYKQVVAAVRDAMIAANINTLDELRMELAKYRFTRFPQREDVRRACSDLWKVLVKLKDMDDWDDTLNILDYVEEKFSGRPDLEMMRKVAESPPS